jgi:hypothetical protein
VNRVAIDCSNQRAVVCAGLWWKHKKLGLLLSAMAVTGNQPQNQNTNAAQNVCTSYDFLMNFSAITLDIARLAACAIDFHNSSPS